MTPLLPHFCARLRREQYEITAGYSDVDLAWRKGWNARANSLLREIDPVERALAEFVEAAPAAQEWPGIFELGGES